MTVLSQGVTEERMTGIEAALCCKEWMIWSVCSDQRAAQVSKGQGWLNKIESARVSELSSD